MVTHAQHRGEETPLVPAHWARMPTYAARELLLTGLARYDAQLTPIPAVLLEERLDAGWSASQVMRHALDDVTVAHDLEPAPFLVADARPGTWARWRSEIDSLAVEDAVLAWELAADLLTRRLSTGGKRRTVKPL